MAAKGLEKKMRMDSLSCQSGGRFVYNGMPKDRNATKRFSEHIENWIQRRLKAMPFRVPYCYIVEFFKKDNEEYYVCDVEVAIGMEAWSASMGANSLIWAFKGAFSQLKRECKSVDLTNLDYELNAMSK